MACRDLISPALDRLPEPPHLERTGVVEIDAKLSHNVDGEVGIADLEDTSDDLLRMPGHVGLASRLARFEQSAQLRVGLFVEAFVGDRHRLADPIERIGCAAPTT